MTFGLCALSTLRLRWVASRTKEVVVPAIHEKTLLFSQFLKSDPKLWVRFAPALPMQAAYYYDAHVKGAVLHRFLLHLTKYGDARQCSCHIALEIGSHTPSRGGLILDVASTARGGIALDSPGLDFADARWAALKDPLVRKARDIVVACRDIYGPPPGAASVPTTCAAYVC